MRKLRLRPKTQKAKKEHVYLEYGNPDACATVRLLPPSLDEQSFLTQAKAHSEALRNGYREFNYQTGTRDVKLFEKPAFSVAHFEFSSVSQAAKVREQLLLKIFHEPQTEDNMLCQVSKPVLGMVYSRPVAKEVSVDHGSTFKAFCSLREETGKAVLLRSIIDELKAAKKKRKKKKKASKQPAEDTEQSKEGEPTSKDEAANSSVAKKKKRSKKKKAASSGGGDAVSAARESGEAGANSGEVTETASKKRNKRSKAGKKAAVAETGPCNADNTKKSQELEHGAAGQAATPEPGSAKPKKKRKRKPKDGSKTGETPPIKQ